MTSELLLFCQQTFPRKEITLLSNTGKPVAREITPLFLTEKFHSSQGS